jgi:hypothetical protein
MKLTVPNNTLANIMIPKAENGIGTIFINGKRITPDSTEQNFFRLTGLSSGNYTVKFQPLKKIPIPSKETFTYLYQPATEDRVTQGNWKGKYGSAGYVLCNYDSINNQRKKLPGFIGEIRFRLNGDFHATKAGDDPRTLETVSENEGNRKFGAIITKDPSPCLQTMTIDIECTKNQPYQVALYMVDWEKEGRRSAVEVFNLNNKALLMAVHQVKDYQNGKYIILKADRSIRIRINQVRGSNASLSALFIDE